MLGRTKPVIGTSSNSVINADYDAENCCMWSADNKSATISHQRSSEGETLSKARQFHAIISAIGLGSIFCLYGSCLWGGAFSFGGILSISLLNLYTIAWLLGSLVSFIARPISISLEINSVRFYQIATPISLFVSLGLLVSGLWSSSVAILLIAGFGIGFSVAALFMFWVDDIAQYPTRTMHFVFVGALIIPALFNGCFAFTPQEVVLPVTCIACGLIALGSYAFALRNRSKTAPVSLASTTSIGFRKAFQTLLAPLACAVALLLIAPAINYVALGDELVWQNKSALISLAQILTAVILLVLMTFIKDSSLMVTVFVGAVPVLAIALFLFPFMGFEYRQLLLLIGSCLFFFVMVLMMVDCVNAAKESKAAPSLFYGLCGAATFLVTYFGEEIMRSVVSSGISRDMQMIATAFFLIYLLSVAFFFAQSRKKDRVKYGLEDEAPAVESTDRKLWRGDAEARTIACCNYIQESKGLSDREIEVLQKILHGKNVPAISTELFISQNTVRTHVKKIYRTLDVHSRQELIEHIETLSKEF